MLRMTSHTNPAVTKANPPKGGSSASAGSDVRAGSAEEEEVVQDEQKVAPNFLQKKKNKNHVPLVKASTKKKPGEKPEEGAEEEEDMTKSKKKEDGCGCPLKSKKKKAKMDRKKCDGLTPELVRGDACWKGYKQVGMKMKGGRQVPDCVPVSGKSKKKDTMKKDSVFASGFKFDGKALHMESQNLAATDTERAKRKKNAQGQPKNKIMAGTRNT